MKSNSEEIARALLLTWIATDEKKSYDSIRKNCVYLDRSYSLNMGDSALWKLFGPLIRTGVVDYIGKDNYAFAKPVAIFREGIYTYTGIPKESLNSTNFTGIYRTRNSDDISGLKIVSFDGTIVLKNMPSVDKIVDAFDKSVEDLSNADYYHWKGKKGLTKRLNDGTVRYFCIPDMMYQREVPGRTVNPDAFSISYNWSRALNYESSGIYSASSKTLIMQSFALPIMIERILFLESMTKGMNPIRRDREIEFPAIPLETAKEIDRILCKTIKYE